MANPNEFPGVQTKVFSASSGTGEPIAVGTGTTTLHGSIAARVELVEIYVSNPTDAPIDVSVEFGLTPMVTRTILPKQVMLVSQHEVTNTQIDLSASATGLYAWAIITEKTPLA